MGIFNTLMADSVGVLWRAGTGTVDPWTKDCLASTEQAALVQAGAQPCDAAAQACADTTAALLAEKADPSQAACGLKGSLSSFFCLTNNVGKTVLFVAVGAAILYFLFIYSAARR